MLSFFGLFHPLYAVAKAAVVIGEAVELYPQGRQALGGGAPFADVRERLPGQTTAAAVTGAAVRALQHRGGAGIPLRPEGVDRRDLNAEVGIFSEQDQLLDDAGLISAEDRGEAQRDAKTLAGSDLVRLRCPRFRPHLIERILIPVEAEQRLAGLFGDPLASDRDTVDLATIPWEPELLFLREERVNVATQDLLAMNQFLAEKFDDPMDRIICAYNVRLCI